MPADIYSSILGWLSMYVGNDNASWGANANNSVFTILEKAISGRATHAVTGGTLPLDTTSPPTGTTAALEYIHEFTGTLVSDQIVVVPNLTKSWLVRNATTGSFTLTFKTTDGDESDAIQQGGWCFVYCDGDDTIALDLSTAMRDVQWIGADGSASLPGLSYGSEATSGVLRRIAGAVGFAILSTEVLEVSASGADITSGLLSVGGIGAVPSGLERSYAGIDLPAGWLWEDGTAYSRSTYANLFAVLSKSCTGNTNSNTTIDNLSVDLRGMGLEGSKIEGTGIVTGTTIVSVNSASALTLSQATLSTSVGLSLVILPWGQGDGSTTFNVPDRRYRTLIGRDDMNNNNAARSSTYAGKKLITTGGEETHILTTAEMASHTHTGTTGTESVNHTHSYTDTTAGGQSWSGGGNLVGSIGRDALLNGTSGTESATHTHSFTSDSTGSSTGHDTMAKFGMTNWIIRT